MTLMLSGTSWSRSLRSSTSIEVALAAVKLASDASGALRDEEELPEVELPPAG